MNSNPVPGEEASGLVLANEDTGAGVRKQSEPKMQ